jgi:uncharacterized membrane protein (UPF0127 family)
MLRRVLVVTCWAAVLIAVGCTTAERVTLGDARLRVVVADDEVSRVQGLQGYDGLEPDEGMLFEWADADIRSFAMKEVSFPIEVVFIDEGSRVSAIYPLQPGDTHVVTSPSPCRYVVEVPAGWTADHDVSVGSLFERAP